jgi:ketosteroid isomerase-like protein
MTEQEVQLNQLEQRIIRAWLENDRETIDAVLADDWTVIDPSGRVLTKAQIMEEAFESGARKIEAGSIDEVKVRTFGDFAVVTGRTTAAGSYLGISFSVTLRFTDVCEKRGADWQVVASQGTLIAQ